MIGRYQTEMKLLFQFATLLLLFAPLGCAQDSISQALQKYNAKTVPYITAEELAKTETMILLDTREKEEYNVSHLKNAVWVGFKDFDIHTVSNRIQDKNTPLIVYCSIGVRSEDIGEKLIGAGYTNVKNLYGGIFEWKNNGNPVYGTDGLKTDKVHPYDKQWGKLLTNAEKVYTP